MKKKLFFGKDEDNNKEISISNLIIILFFIFAVIYVAILLIKNAFERPSVYDHNNINQYISEDKILKTDYFYTIDAQVANFLEAVDREMYDDLYSILKSNYNKIYSKNEIKKYLSECREKTFIYDEGAKVYTGHVLNVYIMENNNYLVQLDFDNGNFYIVITNGLKKYNFTIVE